MSKDQDAFTKKDKSDPASTKKIDEASKAEKSSTETKRSSIKEDELEEGLEESLPGSDAPASTRRS